METITTGIEAILPQIEQAATAFIQLLHTLDENQLNRVPYEDSWTAAQLSNHVAKSTSGIAMVLLKEGKPSGRPMDQQVQGLKQTFLDFTIKMKSPEMILPDPGPYKKERIIDAVQKAYELLKKNAVLAKPGELLEGLPMGAITKFELVHFVLYHTQRHLQQLQKISDALHR